MACQRLAQNSKALADQEPRANSGGGSLDEEARTWCQEYGQIGLSCVQFPQRATTISPQIAPDAGKATLISVVLEIH